MKIFWICSILSFHSLTLASYSSPAFVVRRRRSSFANPTAFWAQRPKHDSSTRLFLERPSNSTLDYTPLHSAHKKSSSTELSYSMTDVADLGVKVYCDLDGVLVDFEKGVMNLLNTPSSKLIKGTMWKTIARANAFYEHLSWTRDGKRLWNAIRHLQPDILTGVPYPKSSREEKFNWCKRELGLEELHHVDMAAGCRDHESVNGNLPREDSTNIITCWSNNKHFECRDRSILIDDRDSLRETWEQAGGIFVHHVDAETTIQKLIDYGILSEDQAGVRSMVYENQIYSFGK